ncbi:MAG: beta-eliminating lyase-related protein [Paracoccaceae bacterium]|nr:beta-eliminating lyase-related protein [Paracoccaceae bacterium]
MYFASDNSGPAAPEILDALISANLGYAPAYGSDEIMDTVRASIREIFEAPDAAVFLVATGTAANALALATLVDPWQTIFCHRHSHAEEDECGAPEFYSGGAKLTLVDGDHGKIDPAELDAAVLCTGQLGVHGVQRGALSITNVTERGTVYTPDEIGALTAIAHRHGIRCHLDGARLANALVSLGCSPAEATWKSGIDLVSFGGTKNGLIGVEAVIMFDPGLAWEFELRRKRGGHLFSKHRFLSAQMAAYLHGGLWLDLARRSNAAAKRLASGLLRTRRARLIHPSGANMIFAGWPRSGHQRARKSGAQYYLWPPDQSLEGAPDEVLTARLVCNWSTTEDDVDRFLERIQDPV